MKMQPPRQRYEVVIGGGYTTWCRAISLEAAEQWAQQRYGHITDDIAVKEVEDIPQ
jgi:hypothetical protein